MKSICEKGKFDELKFWGRIRGKESNYYIAVAYKFNEFEFPAKGFFYATSNFSFSPLPKLNPLFAEKAEDYNQEFTGNPDLVLFEITEKIKEEVDLLQVEAMIQEELDSQKADLEVPESNEIPEDDFQPKKIEQKIVERQVVCKEVDRLGLVVRAIEFECACLPKGALKMSITHQLRYNQGFRGLAENEVLNARNWLHFRQPVSESKKEEIKKADAIFATDFLEDISEDLPRKCWSLQMDLRKELVF